MSKRVWEERGKLWPMSIPIAQTWNEVGAILMTIQECKIGTMIEIGMDQGGLSAVLLARGIFDEHFHYFGIEIRDNRVEKMVMIHNVERYNKEWMEPIRIDDVFSGASQEWMRYIIRESAGVVLIFCDGGNKVREVKTFQKFLRSGDYIMAHDLKTEIKRKDFSPLQTIHYPWLHGTSLAIAQMGLE
jgi:hypothetical protein